MTDPDQTELEHKVAYLERHVEEQDSEIWRLTQRVDKLAVLLKQQNEQIKALNERGSEVGSPADEKPPHY